MKKKNDQLKDPYKVDLLARINPKFKIGFMKFWVAGACYLLSFMTSETVSNDSSTEFLILLILLTLLNEYFVSKIIIWMNREDRPLLKYLPFENSNRKSVKNLFLTMLYSLVMIILTIFIFYLIKVIFKSIHFKTLSYFMLGEDYVLEPITFGLIYLLSDYIWFLFKKLFKKNKAM